MKLIINTIVVSSNQVPHSICVAEWGSLKIKERAIWYVLINIEVFTFLPISLVSVWTIMLQTHAVESVID